MSFFSVNISTDNTLETYVGISKILNLFPEDYYNLENPESEWNSIHGERYCLWVYSEDFNEEIIYSNSLNTILDIIEPNLLNLENIGIKKDKIFFILHIDTESDTEIIFNPKDMLRIGTIGIELSISTSLIKD